MCVISEFTPGAAVSCGPLQISGGNFHADVTLTVLDVSEIGR